MSILLSASSPVDPTATDFRSPLSSSVISAGALPAPAAAAAKLSLTSVKLSQISLKMASSAGYGKIFAMDLKSENNYYMIEFLATTPPLPVDDNDALGIVMGAGVRIALMTKRVEGQVSLNLAALAAQTNAGISRTDLRLIVSGVPNDMNAQFYTDFGNSAILDMEAIRRFGTAVSNLAAAMVKEAGKDAPGFALKPWHVKETVPLDDIKKTRAASVNYALARILKGDTVESAKQYLNKKHSDDYPFNDVDESIVESMYRSIVGNGQAPSERAKALADNIYSLGA